MTSELGKKLYEKLGMAHILRQNPDSREQLKAVMAWYPNKKFYKRQSHKSGKTIISVYPPESVCPVYSHEEWYSDDFTSPGLDIDPQKSVFEQFAELQKIAPVVTLLSTQQQNAEYCHDVEGLKNSYIVFDAITGQDIYYSVRMYDCKSCVDCYFAMESELLYECVYMFNCYNTRYSYNCKQVTDSYFLFDCRNTQNSFMCSGLRNQKHCIYNQQYTKEQYEEFIAKIDFSNFEKMEELKKHFRDSVVGESNLKNDWVENCEDVSNCKYLKNSKDCERLFESFELRDCYNGFQNAKGKDIVDSYMCNDRVEMCFQCVATGIDSQNVYNCAFTWHSSNMRYCYLCINCQDCFGCIGLRGKKYNIFNKSYLKEEYEKLVKRIIENMKKPLQTQPRQGGVDFGKFFPMNLSPFRYEDTIAYDLFSADMSVRWGGTVNIGEVNYSKQELAFYEKYAVPKPREPFEIRYRKRMELMGTRF